jgi:flavin-dependent dehydrogenase
MFLEGVRFAGQRLGTELTRSAALVSRPTSPSQLHLGEGSVALVGEAAGLISPSSAEGISYAMRSAAALAEAFRPGTDEALERYRSTAAPLVFEVCAKMVKARTIGSPWAREALMRAGIGSLSPGAPVGYGSTWAELLAP